MSTITVSPCSNSSFLVLGILPRVNDMQVMSYCDDILSEQIVKKCYTENPIKIA
jgi:hypothetical protein